MGIFYQEKAFHAGKKSGKNDFPPSEKYACFAPACDVACNKEQEISMGLEIPETNEQKHQKKTKKKKKNTTYILSFLNWTKSFL